MESSGKMAVDLIKRLFWPDMERRLREKVGLKGISKRPKVWMRLIGKMG